MRKAKAVKKVTAKDRRKKERRAVRLSAKMCHDKWSRAVRDRDKRCLRCGKTEYLQGHHWYVGKRICPAMALDEDNGMTLCLKCHKVDVHKAGTYTVHAQNRAIMLRVLGKARYNALVERAKQAACTSAV